MLILRRVAPSLFYGWVIVATAFLVFIVMSGVWSSFAVFYVALVEDFGWSRAVTAGVFSVYMAAMGLSAPVAGWLADRFGPRRVMPCGGVIWALGLALASRISEPWQLYLVYGVVIAFGQSCIGFIPHLRLIANWFARRRGAAFGIATAGAGFGSVILVPVIQSLILQFGWRQAYLVLAGMALLLVPLTALVHRQHPADVGQFPDGDEGDVPARLDEDLRPALAAFRHASPFADFSLGKALSTANLWMMFVSNVFFGLATIVAVLQVAHIVGVGFAPMLAAMISGLVGLLVAIGRMLGGIFADRLGKPATGLVGVFLLSLGVLALILAGVVQMTWLLFAYGILFGFGWGFFGIVGAAITGELFQGKSYGAIAGFLELGVGIGGFIGPWLGGYLFDRLGSYNLPLIIAVASAWLGSVCFKLAYRGMGPSVGRMK